MSVQVATCSAAQLFSECLHPEPSLSANAIITSDNETVAGALTIPEYQRPYCWQDKQLDSLLQDIASHTQRNAELPYYLGSLILHKEDGKLNIIDGQQRITTLALMGCLLDSDPSTIGGLVYEHPISQQQIKHNLQWLRDRLDRVREGIDFHKLQFTLVITESEDDTASLKPRTPAACVWVGRISSRPITCGPLRTERSSHSLPGSGRPWASWTAPSAPC